MASRNANGSIKTQDNNVRRIYHTGGRVVSRNTKTDEVVARDKNTSIRA